MTPLHHIGNFLRDLFGRLPLEVVRGIFIAVPVILLVWVLLLPRSAVVPLHGSGRWDANLKIWACLTLVIQILIYSVF